MRTDDSIARRLTWVLTLSAALVACGPEETDGGRADAGDTTDSGRADGGGSTADGGSEPNSPSPLAPDTTGASCNQRSADSSVDTNLNASYHGWASEYQPEGQSLSVQIRVLNLGTNDVGPFASGIYLYPDDGGDGCSAYRVGTISSSGQAAQSERIQQGTFDLGALSGPVPPGTYRVGFVVDVENAHAEDDESDNVFLMPGRLTL